MDSKSGKGLYCGLEAFNSQLHEQVLFYFFQVTLGQYFKTLIEDCLMAPKNGADSSHPKGDLPCTSHPGAGFPELAAGPGGGSSAPEQLWAPDGLCPCTGNAL